MTRQQHGLTRYVRPEILTGMSPASLERHAVAQRQLSLADIKRTVARRKFLLFGFAAIIFCAAAAYAFLKKPLYEGVARVQIDPTRSSNLGLDDSDKPVSTDADSHVA